MKKYPIQLSHAARPSTVEVMAINERGEEIPTPIAGEHPLTVYVDKREMLTLMTLGAAPEALVVGWLRNQRLLDRADEIAAVQVDWETNSVAVTTRYLKDEGKTLWEVRNVEDRLAHRTVTTGCGQGTVFGDLMAEIDNISLPDTPSMSEEVLYGVMDNVRRHESIYKQAGAVHGCALCSNAGENRSEILFFVEDVGRHNAVDAIAGLMWLNDVPGGDKIFYTTGRLTSEMVIKCAQMGIAVLVSRSGLTEMGHAIAQRIGITMIGRCQGKHYLLFTGRHRFNQLPNTLLA